MRRDRQTLAQRREEKVPSRSCHVVTPQTLTTSLIPGEKSLSCHSVSWDGEDLHKKRGEGAPNQWEIRRESGGMRREESESHAMTSGTRVTPAGP